MRDRERNGVRLGQPVRDLEGVSLGKVVRLFAWGFQARRGLPLFTRGEHVIRYDEIRGVRGGALVVARSRRDLLDHAAGELPPSWRTPTPAAFPSAATPGEARLLQADVAAGRVPGAGSAAEGTEPAQPDLVREPRPLSDDEVRAYVDTRGQGLLSRPAPGDRR